MAKTKKVKPLKNKGIKKMTQHYYSRRQAKREEWRVIMGEIIAGAMFLAGVLSLGALFMACPGYY